MSIYSKHSLAVPTAKECPVVDALVSKAILIISLSVADAAAAPMPTLAFNR